MAALWRWIGSLVYSFGPHGGLRESIFAANAAFEGALGALTKLLGSMGHLLGAGPIQDPIFREHVAKPSCFTQLGAGEGALLRWSG